MIYLGLTYISSYKLLDQTMKNDSSIATWLKKKDEISSQISAQIFEFCDPDQFQETLQNSEATSSPNCCYADNSSYATNLTLSQELETKFSTYQDSNNGNNTDSTLAPAATTSTTNTTTSSTNTATASTNAVNINASNADATNNNGSLSIIFDSQEEIDNDISASINFSTSPSFSVHPYLMSQQDQQFDFSPVQTQMPLANSIVEGFSNYTSDHVPPLMSAPYSSVFEEDFLSSVPSYVPLNPSSPSCSFLGPNIGAYMPAGSMNPAALSADTGIFTSSILMASELQAQDMDYQGDNGGIFCQDSLSRGFNPNDLQVLGAERQQQLNGNGNSASLATEIPMAEDPNFKVGKLSPEERKEKIHRYMKKRNERNFTKKIKYACRKKLADSRPRNRGRFAKNNKCGENDRPNFGCDHEDNEEKEVVVKQEENMVDSSDIFSHISGVNSLKCNYPIQSWMS